MRALGLAALGLAALSGCGSHVRACKAGTVLVTVDVPVGTAQLVVAVTLDGTTSTTQRVALPPGGTTHGTVELDFSTYPAGHSLDVTVTAASGVTTLGSATSGAHTLATGCDAIHLTVTTPGGPGQDLAGRDVGGSPSGCGTAADCPMGQACSTATGLCTTSCSASQACNGGCCDGSMCVAGTALSACALGNALCASCASAAAGHACLSMGGTGVCGCTSASDCPVNQACSLATHTCGNACDSNTPCNTGCCSSPNGGTCQTGTLDAACGSNGAVCGSCVANQNGHKCIAITGGGQCGCNLLADCGVGASACDAGHLCVNMCTAGNACQSGCCSSSSSGTCQPGTTVTACGAIGTVCNDCQGNANGNACLINGTCGCSSAGDCPTNQACDGSTHHCTMACGGMQPCNGGCCSGGTCAVGNAPDACGTTGGDCTVCPAPTTCAPSYGCPSGACVPSYADSSAECAAANNAACLAASFCNGASSSCPPQGPAMSTVVCRGAGIANCDRPANCDGVNAGNCPPSQSYCTSARPICCTGSNCIASGQMCP
jgi:hypothetical protein